MGRSDIEAASFIVGYILALSVDGIKTFVS